jgi:hypothetical protein
MTTSPDSISDISKAIQLALGPVFLLTGIAGLLNVMSGRLTRIIDRGRAITEGTSVTIAHTIEEINEELSTLEKRRKVTSIAITLCTISALLVCLVIVALFTEVLLNIPLNWIIGALFMLSTIGLVGGLSFFLREVHMAANTIRIKVLRENKHQ